MRRLLLVLAFALLVPAAAAQGAIRLGPDVTIPPPSGGFHLGAIGCQSAAQYNPCSYLNVASTNPDVVVASPIKGVITSWSFRAGCCTDPQTVAHHITLGTFRPPTFNGYVYATAHLQGDTFELPPGNAILADTPTTLKARVPIDAGEVIGAIADGPIAFAVNDTIPGVTYTTLFNGFTYGNPQGGATISLSAMVEPDADVDGFGDETQDCAPADAAVHEGCAPATPPVSLPAPPGPPSVGCNAPVCAGTTGGSGTPAPPPIPAPVPKTGTIAPPSDPNSVYISLACPPNVPQYCGGYLILVPGGAKQAASTRTRYSIAPGKSKAIKIPLSTKLRRQLKRTHRVKVTLRLQPDGGAKATTFTRTIKLKHKPARKR